MNDFHRYLTAWRAIHDDCNDPFVEAAVTDCALPDPENWDDLSAYLLGKAPTLIAYPALARPFGAMTD